MKGKVIAIHDSLVSNASVLHPQTTPIIIASALAHHRSHQLEKTNNMVINQTEQ